MDHNYEGLSEQELWNLAEHLRSERADLYVKRALAKRGTKREMDDLINLMRNEIALVEERALALQYVRTLKEHIKDLAKKWHEQND